MSAVIDYAAFAAALGIGWTLGVITLVALMLWFGGLESEEHNEPADTTRHHRWRYGGGQSYEAHFICVTLIIAFAAIIGAIALAG